MNVVGSEEINLNSQILKDLNPEQKKAAAHEYGPILVLAGAGSGKTRVLTHRIAHLIDLGVRADKILAVTFTNKATEEMRERLKAMLGSKGNMLWVATFHSACLRILRRHAKAIDFKNDFVVYDDKDSENTVKRVLKNLKIEAKKDETKAYRRSISDVKNKALNHRECKALLKDLKLAFAVEVFDNYQRELFNANAMDFDDLILNTVILLKENEEILNLYRKALDYILIDEFQDTNSVQYELIKLISKPKNNLFVVGDDDQSIYAFRGADSTHILNFNLKDYPDAKVIKLEQNYRSTANILSAANSVIVKNANRKAKELWTEKDSGEKIKTFVGNDENDEATFITQKIEAAIENGVALSEIALFYRTNAQSRALEEALNNYGIAYRIYGGLRFYDRKEIKDLIAYLRLIKNKDDNEAFLRVVNNPPRGIGLQSIQNIINVAREESVSLYKASETLAIKNKKLAAFTDLIAEFDKTAETEFVSTLIDEISTNSGYTKRIKELKDGTAESRLENIQELKGLARRSDIIFGSPAEALSGFLDKIALTSSTDMANKDTTGDEKEEAKQEAVTLMTLHMAKGLEFELVFLTGFEQGLLPHSRTLMNPAEIEEERRLCYVGMTRAKKELYLTKTKFRSMFSSGSGFGISGQFREASQFFFDIPDNLIKTIGDNFADYENDSDDEDFGINNIFVKNKKKKTKTINADNILSFIKPAEKLSKKDFDATPIEEIKVNDRVEHPHFGEGKVTEFIEHKSGELKKAKIVIFFDSLEASRILMLGSSGIRVIN